MNNIIYTSGYFLELGAGDSDELIECFVEDFSDSEKESAANMLGFDVDEFDSYISDVVDYIMETADTFGNDGLNKLIIRDCKDPVINLYFDTDDNIKCAEDCGILKYFIPKDNADSNENNTESEMLYDTWGKPFDTKDYIWLATYEDTYVDGVGSCTEVINYNHDYFG